MRPIWERAGLCVRLTVDVATESP